MSLLSIFQHRHSIRKYTDEAISKENLTKIIQAGLLSASGRAIRPWEFIVVKDKEMLTHLSGCRTGAAKMLEQADTAIVVIADENATDVWIEDCSIALANMHLMADSLGVGSCWIQGRLRTAPDERSTEEYVRECLHFPENYKLEAILSLGMPKEQKAPTELTALPFNKIHNEQF